MVLSLDLVALQIAALTEMGIFFEVVVFITAFIAELLRCLSKWVWSDLTVQILVN